MSSAIWTQCAGGSELRPLRLLPWRAVEAQHLVSTRKLVDTLEEQELLEELIDGAKPPVPLARPLHYLLSTPFRYPPLSWGSRFGSATERGIWYGAEGVQTVFAEVAYYRLLFLEGTSADLGTVVTPLTLFRVRVHSQAGIDLAAAPFDAHRDVIASPVSFAESQALGRAMRAAGVEVFRYPAARDSAGGIGVGVFTPSAFGNARPRDEQTWICTATHTRIEFVRTHARTAFVFARAQFEVQGELPLPAS
jgi:hypothetical protein